MRRHTVILGIVLILTFNLLGIRDCFSQIKEEREEKTLEIKKLEKKIPAYKLSSSAGMFFGYDNNVHLSPAKKGDVFEEFLYSLTFIKPWVINSQFTLNYDLDVLNYSEVTDLSNILNHFRFGLHKGSSKIKMGLGYDLGIFEYFDNDDGDFLFHKGFFYVRHFLSRRLYQQFLFEGGLKEYTHRKALSDTISTYQDKELLDKRKSVEYSLGYAPGRKLFLRLKTKFTVNDSNARYLDYYDYRSYEVSPHLKYTISEKLEFLCSFTFLKRHYTSRVVTATNYKQKDDIYAANAGLRYKVGKKSILSLLYTYRNNASNDDLEKYTDSIISIGWQYNF